MPNTHCGKHNKLSKTMGVTIGLMEELIISQCPYWMALTLVRPNGAYPWVA